MIYFKHSEFDTPGSPGTGKKMCPAFLYLLGAARATYGKPMRITSGFRTKKYNQDLQRRGYAAAKNSSHLYGCAADVACADTELIEMLNTFWQVGFRRFGIMGGAVHVDSDAQKPRPTMWSYGNEDTQRWKLAKEWFDQKVKDLI